ncbi:MAG: hypothetical protein KatS3mg102_0063 [Planctomycetota bacterium]|nr:MAG: hypothetical protein KatS3mg102_0063 [Planctomycetota bacterium]
MSVGGAGWPGRLEPAGADSGLEEAAESAAARSAAENAPPAAASTSGARHAVLAGLGAGPREEALVLEGYEVAVAADGRLLPAGPTPPEGGPLGLLNALALRPAGAPGPFDGLGAEHAGLLDRLSARLAQTHKALAGEAPDEATHLAWRQGRAAALHLMEEAAARAFALGDGALGRRILRRLTAAVQAEPWRQVRDFAFERLVARAEASELPEVRAAREALYPSRPPYEKWLADGKIDILMYVDDSGSLIADNIEFYKELGFRHTANADGSHTLRLDRSGEEPPVVITIPPKQGTPALFEKMDDPAVDVIAYAGHAGYGHRVDHALARGVGGSGEGKLVLLMQCWGEGNVESLERAYPDAQVLSTTAMTDDNLDFTLMENLIDGFRKQQSWKQIERRTERDLKRWFGDDPDYRYTDLESHYFFPTTRSTLVKHYDRDGDGVKDGQDHIFHVIYPKRVDASGGYDPVVQPIPRHALDGTALGRSVSELSLAIRYNHLLPPELERRLPWDPERWRPGGFFEPAGGRPARLPVRARRGRRGAGDAVEPLRAYPGRGSLADARL